MVACTRGETGNFLKGLIRLISGRFVFSFYTGLTNFRVLFQMNKFSCDKVDEKVLGKSRTNVAASFRFCYVWLFGYILGTYLLSSKLLCHPRGSSRKRTRKRTGTS